MDNINLYKEITLEIIQCLKDENLDDLDTLFDKRQSILTEEEDNKNFKASMIALGIVDLDKNIKDLLHQNIINTKIEIQKHKLSTITNNSYINSNQQKINIFNTKV